MIASIQAFIKAIPGILAIIKGITKLIEAYQMMKIEKHYKAKDMAIKKLTDKIKEEVLGPALEKLKERLSIISK